MSRLVLEFRAGEGGRDAEVFSAELRDALLALARHRGDVASFRPSPGTGRTLVVNIDGDRAAYQRFAGVHRIQRVPRNDRRGRRQSSTVTVAVLNERKRSPIVLDDGDLVVQPYRGTGAGGQRRNKVMTAARVTHRPTGLVVSAEEERSFSQNVASAKRRLVAALESAAARAANDAEAAARNRQIAAAERPAKTWTHNRDQRSEVVCHSTGERWPWRAFYAGRID